MRITFIVCFLFPSLLFGQISIGDSQGVIINADSTTICGNSANSQVFSISGASGHYDHTIWSTSSSAISILFYPNNDSTKALVSWNPNNVPFTFQIYINDTVHGFSDSLYVSVNAPPSVILNNHWNSIVSCAFSDTTVSGGSPPGVHILSLDIPE